MAAVVRSVVCSGRGASGSLSSILHGTGSGPYNLAGTAPGNTCSSILVGAVACPTVLGGAGSVPTVLGGTGSVPTVLGGTGSVPTVLGGTGSVPTVLGGTGSVPTVLGGTGSGTTVLGGTGSGTTVLGGTGSGSTHLSTGASYHAIAAGSVRSFSSSPSPSSRSFSSSSSSSLRETLKAKWQKHKPGADFLQGCTLLGAGGSFCYFMDYGYNFVLKRSEKASEVFIDQKLTNIQDEHQNFQTVATVTHQDFVRGCQQATADMQHEVSKLRSRMLALESQELKQRKDLLSAADILQKAGVGDAAAAKD